MRSRTVAGSGTAVRTRAGRRALAGVALAPVLALSLAGCGGDGGGGDGGGGAEEAKPLTKAQLNKALLKSDDVAGYKVRKTPDPLKNENLPKAQADCRPVLDAFGPDAKQERKAYVGAGVTKGEMTTGQTVNQVLLASYAGGDAKAVLADLKAGLKTCKEIKGSDGKKEKVLIQEEQAPDLGDEAVRFVLKGGASEQGALSMTVVRTGTNTTSFLSLALSGKKAEVPSEVAEKQVSKLEAAAAKG